jgi:uncharacterized membrane protein
MNEKIKLYFKELPKKYFITAFSGMAQGLFVTLIAGTILALIAKIFGNTYIGNTLTIISNIAKTLMGAGIGVGIAYSLKKNKLITFVSAVAGTIGAFADKLMPGSDPFTTLSLGTPGNPIGSYVVTMLVVEICELFAGKTKLDIVLIPLTALTLSLAGIFIAYPFIWLINQFGLLIAYATNATPFVMGIIVSAVMGILLTMPTSSAAIWISISASILTENNIGTVEYESMMLAGSAATVGCACHMIGFAVSSFRENKISGLISQGLGTSMLQIPNIMKKPIIMLPEIIASAILGPIATCIFQLRCGKSGGGMGTSGLVGLFDLLENNDLTFINVLGIILLMFILPALITFIISEFMRKKGWIKFGDMELKD